MQAGSATYTESPIDTVFGTSETEAKVGVSMGVCEARVIKLRTELFGWDCIASDSKKIAPW